MTPALARALDLHEPKGQLPAHPTDEQTAAFRFANQLRASLKDDSWPKKVAAFRRLYGLSDHNNVAPARLPAARNMLHRSLLDEELAETFMADSNNDLTETVDGILDLIYVALGWLLEMGFTPQQIDALMEEVHASNMTKTDDAGQPIFNTDGKVLKGDNFVPVDLHSLITNFSIGLNADGTDNAEGTSIA